MAQLVGPWPGDPGIQFQNLVRKNLCNGIDGEAWTGPLACLILFFVMMWIMVLTCSGIQHPPSLEIPNNNRKKELNNLFCCCCKDVWMLMRNLNLLNSKPWRIKIILCKFRHLIRVQQPWLPCSLQYNDTEKIERYRAPDATRKN